jgi:hypothetical protein
MDSSLKKKKKKKKKKHTDNPLLSLFVYFIIYYSIRTMSYCQELIQYSESNDLSNKVV